MSHPKPYDLENKGADLTVTVHNRTAPDLMTAIMGSYFNPAGFIGSLLLLKGKSPQDIGYGSLDDFDLAIHEKDVIFTVKDMRTEDFEALYAQGKAMGKAFASIAGAYGLEITMPGIRYSSSLESYIPSFQIDNHASDENVTMLKAQLKARGMQVRSSRRDDYIALDIIPQPGVDLMARLQEMTAAPSAHINQRSNGNGIEL